MRQIGSLKNSDDAARFTAYLVTQRIDAAVEPDGEAWAIWARDEDQLAAAREAFEDFRRAPEDPRYRQAFTEAQRIQREEEGRRKQARKNVVEMRGRWKSGPAGGSIFKRAPLTCVLIGLSLFVSFSTGFRSDPRVAPRLMIANPARADVGVNPWTEIAQGQVWRLVTPIFLHFGYGHLIFNMIMTYILGTRLESRYSAWRLGLMVLLVAVASNVAQLLWEGNPRFGGMSGVVYGMFGYVWMKMLFDPQAGLWIERSTVYLAIGWMFLCMLADVPPFNQYLGAIGRIANTAHFIGLASGMALAVAPLAWRRSP